VRLNETLVGTITRAPNDTNFFAFDSGYVSDLARPTLSLQFKGTSGTLIEKVRPTHTRLPTFFSNLLPEGHLREYLAARGKILPEREFFLLWLLGSDLPGAVEIKPLDGVLPPEAKTSEERARSDDKPLRFSLAGVQLKFSAVMESDGGLTLPIGGVGGDWIAKLPSPRYRSVPENEHAMMTLASKVGIDVPEVKLVTTTDIHDLPRDLPEAFGTTFVVRRFDRTETGERIHTEDFAQVFDLYARDKYEKASYANIAEVLWLENGEKAVTEFIRRLTFNVLIGNADAHLKNWSLIYPDGRTPQLAPAYDLVATVAYIPRDSLGLSIGGTKAFEEIDANSFRRLANKAGLPSRLVLKTVAETTEALRDSWGRHEPLDQLPKDLREQIAAHMSSIQL
jgi:serine/threonine-protein kinase HipA